MADAIELIKADHRTVENLYQRYQSSTTHTQPQSAIIQEICQALVIHAQLEEAIFYPVVERRLGKEGTRVITEALKEHNEMKRAIGQLQASALAGPECDRVFREMMKGAAPCKGGRKRDATEGPATTRR